MKWFKHISDSLDDPFIFDLMTEFKSDGYVVFFGILEIYSREFSSESEWKLVVSLSYFHQKLRVSPSKVKKILSKIYKWEVGYNGNQVTIFIPKFTQLLDEWTQRKLGSQSGVTPEILKRNKDKELDKDKDKPPIVPHKKRGTVYADDFLIFWKEYPRKVGKDAAYRAWRARNGTRPVVTVLVTAIRTQTQSDQWQKENGQFIPNPATWLNQGRWEDEYRRTGTSGSERAPFKKAGGTFSPGGNRIPEIPQPAEWKGDNISTPTPEQREENIKRAKELSKTIG